MLSPKIKTPVMPKRNLTDPFIRSFPNPAKRKEIYDQVVPGLAIRITPTGHKSFVYRYRFGQVKRYTIGKYPAISLAKAREHAKELSYHVSNGIDPMNEKKKKKEEEKVITPVMFQELADAFKMIHLLSLREKTRSEHTRIIDNELIPAFGGRPAKDLTKKAIIAVLDKKAISEGKPTMANRIRTRLHSIYEFGISRGIVESNPVSSISSYAEGENKRDRYYTELELRKLWSLFEQQKEPVQSVLKILLLCAQRSTETRHMRWTDIQDGIWTIPASLSKSNRAHEVPLPDLAIEIIESLRSLNGQSDYVFASPKLENQPIEGMQRSIRKIKMHDEGVADFRPHDLRRTAATYMAKLKVDRTVLGKLLNHKGLAGDSQVTAIYDRHEYLDEKRVALQKWSDELKRILSNVQ